MHANASESIRQITTHKIYISMKCTISLTFLMRSSQLHCRTVVSLMDSTNMLLLSYRQTDRTKQSFYYDFFLGLLLAGYCVLVHLCTDIWREMHLTRLCRWDTCWTHRVGMSLRFGFYHCSFGFVPPVLHPRIDLFLCNCTTIPFFCLPEHTRKGWWFSICSILVSISLLLLYLRFVFQFRCLRRSMLLFLLDHSVFVSASPRVQYVWFQSMHYRIKCS